MGSVRVATKAARYKEMLEIGDVVRVPIPKKCTYSVTGAKTIIGVIYKVHANKRNYGLMTLVGPLDKIITRNGLHVEEHITAAQLDIPKDVYRLSPLLEVDMLALLDPMYIAGKFCKCKKVRMKVLHSHNMK